MLFIDWELWEPLAAGIVVSLINKFVINNQSLLSCCQRECCEEGEDVDARHAAENGINMTTTIDGTETSGSFESHVHIHS